MPMLDRAAELARTGRPLLRLLVGAALIIGIGIVLLILTPSFDALQAMLPALLAVFVWLVCALVFVYAFASVPAPAPAELSGLRRLLRHLSRGLHWLLLFAFVGISIAALWLGARLVAETIA